MLLKWKNILCNWINCYFGDNQIKQHVNLESLITIITNLRDNFNLDESKSSLLEAHTVEEFIVEKYPGFTFGNGTVEANSDEDIHVAASLLLYFVCVNSKDTDIKDVMCSNLNMEDQETIFKFSKCLMECSPITYNNVLSAITEACSQDIALSRQESATATGSIAETPPALRSLHSEVRRLQAALDAERFDRNYLQEELARTNLKLEKLSKDKEQYKLEILNLKAKISMCCGQEANATSFETGAEATSAKLIKELQHLEEKLVDTQGQLNEVQYERDMYKSKVDVFKRERDKWLSLSQQEVSKSNQLAEELETERRNNQSLKELVAELRQHNQLNVLDSSQLECDDPDTSIRSMTHNSSVCSEVCANVVEVQLGEERAKIVELKQHIHSLQEQLNDLTQRSETERRSLQTHVSEKDMEINNLKHHINEEIQEKNLLRQQFNDEMSTLNNNINELELQLKENKDNFNRVIEEKTQEIQTLQEEKISLLQSLSDETTKLNDIIKNLKAEITSERASKTKIREDYDNHIMRLNEKVLNRNNELVEIQNKIFEQSETIELLQQNLRIQKELNEEISNKCNSEIVNLNEQRMIVENNLLEKTIEAGDLRTQLEDKLRYIDDAHVKIDSLNSDISQLHDICKHLEETKVTLLNEVQERDTKAATLQDHVANMRNTFKNDVERYQHEIDEKCAQISALQTQLHNEIQLKLNLQDEVNKLQDIKKQLLEENTNLSTELSKTNTEMSEKDKIIESLNQNLKDEKLKTEKMKSFYEQLETKIKDMKSEYEEKIHEIERTFAEEQNRIDRELREKNDVIHVANQKYMTEMTEKVNLADDFNVKCKELSQLQQMHNTLLETVELYKTSIADLEHKLEESNANYLKLQKDFETETSDLLSKLGDMEKNMKEIKANSKHDIEEKQLLLQTLNIEIDNLQKTIADDRANKTVIENENVALIQKLNEEISFKNKFEKEYQNQCTILKDITNRLTTEIMTKNDEIINLKKEIHEMVKIIEEKSKEIHNLDQELSRETQASRDIKFQQNNEISEFGKKIEFLETINTELKNELKNETKNSVEVIQALRKEIEQLHFTIEEENSNHEIFLKEKDLIIETLEKQLKMATDQLESIQKDYENETLKWEKLKIEMRENLEEKDKRNHKLKEHVGELKNELDEKIYEIEKVTEEMNRKVENIVKEKRKLEKKLVNDYKALQAELAVERAQNAMIALDKDKNITQLISEKSSLIKDNNDLLEKFNLLKQQLNQQHSVIKALNIEKNSLENEKERLSRELEEETQKKKLLEDNSNVVLNEKMNLERRLTDEICNSKILLQEIESLTQKLVEETSAKETAELEKDNLLRTKEELDSKLANNDLILKNLYENNNKLIKDKECLELQLKNELVFSGTLSSENDSLNQKLIEEIAAKEVLNNEKDSLINTNMSLQRELDEQKIVTDTLVADKEILFDEKETLLSTLAVEKAARDELETEKNTEISELVEQKKLYFNELKSKEEEFEKVLVKLASMENESKNQIDENTQLISTVNSGLENLLHKLKEDDADNQIQILADTTHSKDMSLIEQFDLLLNIANTLTMELNLKKNLEKTLEHENCELNSMREMFKQKEMLIQELQGEVRTLKQYVENGATELTKTKENYSALLESKVRDINKLKNENESLNNELNDMKVQLEVKVHSLKEKLIDNEKLTDKLRKSYECQIDNLNVMMTKLTNYLKDKTIDLDSMKKEKERLQQIVDDNNKVIKTLEEDIKTRSANQEKFVTEFESERVLLKNMIAVTESVMEDQKTSLNKTITEYVKINETLAEEVKLLKDLLENEKENYEKTIHGKDEVINNLRKELNEIANEKDMLGNDAELQKENSRKEIVILREDLDSKLLYIDELEVVNKELNEMLQKYKEELISLDAQNNDLKHDLESLKSEISIQINDLKTTIAEQDVNNEQLKTAFEQVNNENKEIKEKAKALEDQLIACIEEKHCLENEKINLVEKLNALRMESDESVTKDQEELSKLKKDNLHLFNIIEENKSVINNLEQLIKQEFELNHQLREDTSNDKLNMASKCSILQEYQEKAEKELDNRQKEISSLSEENKQFKETLEHYQKELREKSDTISKAVQEKDALICAVRKDIIEEKAQKEMYQKELEMKTAEVYELKQKLEEIMVDDHIVKMLRKENEQLVKAVGQRETFALTNQENICKYKYPSTEVDRELRDHQHQVDTTPSDLTNSSLESLKTISDLEKIIHDRNRTITTLNSDISYIKTLMAESENKLIDVTRELEITRENCQQLSSQLKKIVHQKNEEIAELKKQVNKMSATENRASQIVKVSAKYQAIILKRIAEIKSNTVLKELTNYGTNNSDVELRRGLNAGTITMEDLENFLETTDRHLKKCSERQIALQKERDRLSDVNRINESEIINMKKFLTEMSVGFKTFSSVKELYRQKLSAIVCIQRTVRREILNLEGHITDAGMCKLERGYAAVMQDLSECTMNMERWVERCISRTISTEKIKQSFTSDPERTSLAPTTYQNTGLEVQLEELEDSFKKLLEDISRAQRGDAARDAQAVTVMEVRAEYEDKLNRMKAKMKQLYQDQIQVFKDKQKEEIALLEREVHKARTKLAESSREYEEHIKALTSELWSVGEKFLMKKDEADWLRKRSGSLMSLQHVHSSGLVPPSEEPCRPSDAHSLRSLPVNNANPKSEGRGFHMSDEEGEVFDNRFLQELAATPRAPRPAPAAAAAAAAAAPAAPGQRLSELRWRNSLVPPHLKSSYPAETQFAPAIDEDDIKCVTATGADRPSLGVGRPQRKEVGITAYKKPGPPTPSKQAGRLSATDSELRESLRVDMEPQASRKTSTPSRLRSLFRSGKNETAEGTPRSRRLSFFRKKQ